jgi:NAD(P)-dependent dehydrogenase (short-subunit alcohol dehydrogenase family)
MNALPASDSPADAFRFDGQVVFITGAGGSFGYAAATGFAALGAEVFGVDIDEAALDRTISDVRAAGGVIHGLVTDLRRPEDVTRAFATLDATLGRVDVLLNLGGKNVPIGRPEVAEVAAWNDILQTNLTSKFLTSQAAAQRMIAAGRRGSIVNVSSTAATSVLNRDSLAYAVSMAGVIQLTRELAVAWAPYGIRVNAIQPCQFVNPGLQAIIDDPARRAIVDRMISGIPMGRMGVATEMVGPLVFLASSAASMVTGITMPVDGGNLAFNAGGTIPTA